MLSFTMFVTPLSQLDNIDYTNHTPIPGHDIDARMYERAFVSFVACGLGLAVAGMFTLVRIQGRLSGIRDRVEQAQENLSLEDVVTVLVPAGVYDDEFVEQQIRYLSVGVRIMNIVSFMCLFMALALLAAARHNMYPLLWTAVGVATLGGIYLGLHGAGCANCFYKPFELPSKINADRAEIQDLKLLELFAKRHDLTDEDEG